MLFPQNQSIKIRVGRSRYIPLPAEPIPSLTIDRGYVVAAMHDGVVCGIYNVESRKRVKLDMINGRYRQLSSTEYLEFPIDYLYRHSNWTVCLVPHTHCDPWQTH